MRIIDADELKKKIENIKLSLTNKKNILNIIDNAPTVGERPQGEWVFKHDSSDIWCSVCDENYDKIPQEFNFCPNCGADMRGGKEE